MVSLCNSGSCWPQTQKATCFCLPSAGRLYYTGLPKSIPSKARIPEARISAYIIIIVVAEMTLSEVNLHSCSQTGQSVMVYRAVTRAKCENIMITQNPRQQPNPT